MLSHAILGVLGLDQTQYRVLYKCPVYLFLSYGTTAWQCDTFVPDQAVSPDKGKKALSIILRTTGACADLQGR